MLLLTPPTRLLPVQPQDQGQEEPPSAWSSAGMEQRSACRPGGLEQQSPEEQL